METLSNVFKRFLKITPQGQQPELRGNLEIQPDSFVINGWVAEIGNTAPRQVTIRTGALEIRATASALRLDLLQGGINEGYHAFAITLPASLIDGGEHELVLTDDATRQEISRKTCIWTEPDRNYSNFKEFLISSMTQPEVTAPFLEVDRQCFAVMDGLAAVLSQEALEIKSPPLVSVIMPVYNRESVVAEAINSVLAQRYRNFELIVIDDGSTDQTIKIVGEILDPRIKLVRHTLNEGHARARNKGLSVATGEIIAYLDSDNKWDRLYLSANIGAFTRLPDADAIASGQFLYRGYDVDPYAARYGHLNIALLENRNYIDLNALCHRRAILQKVQGFDESLRRFVDYDLILRITDVGKLWTVPLLLSHYYYDKVPNTVTKGRAYPEDLKRIQDNTKLRLAERLQHLDRAGLDESVTAIVLNSPSADAVFDCLEPLLSRNWNGKLKVVVIDDGSLPEVTRILRTKADTGQIILIEDTKAHSFICTLNHVREIQNNDSDILILNGDAIMQPGAIQGLQHAALSFPDAGMAVPRQIVPGGDVRIKSHVPFSESGQAADISISAQNENIYDIASMHDGGIVELSCTDFFAVYMRRDVVGLSDISRGAVGNESRSYLAFCDLMRAAFNKRIYYVPDALVLFKNGVVAEVPDKLD